jgi:hypothetical protein
MQPCICKHINFFTSPPSRNSATHDREETPTVKASAISGGGALSYLLGGLIAILFMPIHSLAYIYIYIYIYIHTYIHKYTQQRAE